MKARHMDIPQSPHDLTPAKLTAILRDAGYLPVGQVTHRHITAANDNNGIIGQTIRIHLDYDRLTDAPASVIAKFPTSHADRRAYFSALGMYAREVHFYRQIADTIPLNLPKCYFTALENTSQRAFLLLEDLSPAHTGDRTAGCSVEVAKHALATIAQLHIAWWNSPRLNQLEWLQAYNQAAFESQFHRSWAAFLADVAHQTPEELLRLGHSLSHNLSVLTGLWQPPLTLIHRDYNLDNLLFKQDDSGHEMIFVIDWQLVRPGRAIFDVATFLCWNLLPAVRRAAEYRLLRYYHERLTSAGIRDYPLDACVADYRLAQLECLARIIAIRGAGVVEEPHLLLLLQTILDRTMAALRDWDVYELLG